MTELFYQTEIWITAQEEELKLSEMKESHRFNCAHYLERNVERIFRHEEMEFFSSGYSPQGEMVQDAFSDEMRYWSMVDPLEWLHGTPLYRALYDSLPERYRIQLANIPIRSIR